MIQLELVDIRLGGCVLDSYLDVNSIYVDYAGEVYRVDNDDQFSFGRGNGADLNIDDENHDLHRRFGRIWHEDSRWWLGNEGSRLPLSIHDLSSISNSTLAPENMTAITFANAAIRFTAGPTNYEILLALGSPAAASKFDGANETIEDGSAPTIDRSKVPVIGGDRLMLVALAEQKLKNPHEQILLPSNKSIYLRLDWPASTFNRRLDKLCARFAAVGVKGLRGDISHHATERRRTLVEHTVKFGIITAADLVLLEDYPTV